MHHPQARKWHVHQIIHAILLQSLSTRPIFLSLISSLSLTYLSNPCSIYKIVSGAVAFSPKIVPSASKSLKGFEILISETEYSSRGWRLWEWCLVIRPGWDDRFVYPLLEHYLVEKPLGNLFGDESSEWVVVEEDV